MRNFITGDVRLKGEVDEKGRLRNVQVVSGPAALRESAIAAFKQYEYVGATRGGKGIASEVKVTIKFWFDP
jgi:TonB family protein